MKSVTTNNLTLSI